MKRDTSCLWDNCDAGNRQLYLKCRKLNQERARRLTRRKDSLLTLVETNPLTIREETTNQWPQSKNWFWLCQPSEN